MKKGSVLGRQILSPDVSDADVAAKSSSEAIKSETKLRLVRRESSHRGVRHEMVIATILILVMIVSAGILAWNNTQHLSTTVSEIELDLLRDQMTGLRELLFQRNPYLQPDTFYLGKLEPVFYFGETTEGQSIRTDADGNEIEMTTVAIAISNIAINIRKGVQYSTNLRSCYWMLEDPEAPYVLVNGSPQRKDEVTDRSWISTCEGMQSDLLIEWRTVPLSYLNSTEVLSIYRRVTCESSRPGETITGFWVLNYHLYNTMNELDAAVQSSEEVMLYSDDRKESVSAGNLELSDSAQTALTAAGEKAVLQGSAEGLLREEESTCYYLAERICDGVAIITCLQEHELQHAMDRTTLTIALVLLVSCAMVVIINVISILRHRRYDRGLRKMLTAMEASSNEPEAERDPLRDENAAETLIRSILDNNVDPRELQSMLESQRELKSELDALYGHVQINSHFLLNTLDSIYWSSVSQSGADSRESAMIEHLCVILKYALDSSDLFTSLAEEAECARMYLEIQRMRKDMQIEAIWDIPDELNNMKIGKLILQPVIENSLQHGFSGNSGAKLVLRISAKRTQDGLLELRVEDNGTGMPKKEMKRMNLEMRRQKYLKSRHIGLANVNRRLQVQFGGESGVSLQVSSMGGLCVVLTMTCSEYDASGLLS